MAPRRDTSSARNQGDISGLFVLAVSAGPLVLLAFGVELSQIAFAPTFVLAVWAATRSWSASTRIPERRRAWATLSVACWLGAIASAVAVASAVGHASSTAALYAGSAASAALLIGAVQFARGSVRDVRPEQVFDAGLAAVLVVAVAAWYVAIPGVAEGDVALTAVFIVDLATLLLASGAALGRLNRRTGTALVLAFAALCTAAGLAALASTGTVGDPGIAVAALWALTALAVAYGADADGKAAGSPDAAADRWPWAQALFPLPIVLALALTGIAEVVARGVRFVPIAYFGVATTAALVLGFARQAYLVVENRRTAERERRVRADATRRNADLEALTGLAATMTESFDEDAIVERGLEVLRLGAQATSAALHVDDEGALALRAASGPWQSERAFAEAPASLEEAPDLEARGGREVMRLPLRSRDGDLGLVTLVSSGHFEDDDRRLLRLLVGQLGMALQNARDYAERLEQAIRDPLTALYNRRYFYEAVQKEVLRQGRYGSCCSLVLIDIDDFKGINDRHGHAVGDEVLVRVAAAVDTMVRPSDTFARLGGEEFGLLLPETEPLDGLLVAERIRGALARHEVLPGTKVRISAGISSCPTDGDTMPVLEKRADQALYWAKRNGKNLCALATEVVVNEEDGAQQHTVASLYSLVAMIDSRLGSGEHSENVAAHATAIAKAMGLDKQRLVPLRRAALLHDIGKLTVGEEVLGKAGPLTPEEFGQIWRHPVVGAMILRHAGLEEEANWVRHHHERMDGEGYPTGLRGDEIPLEARILFVADAFDGMVSDRPYRSARDVPAALEELRANAGSQFDRRVVQALCGLIESGELDLSEEGARA